MNGFDRTMYKIVVVALVFGVIATGMNSFTQLQYDWQVLRTGAVGRGNFQLFTTLFYLMGQFFLALGMLYWIPKVIKKFFPEVS